MALCNFAIQAAAIGVGATATMDLVAIAQRRILNIPSLDYALVGRWIGHWANGQFMHAAIIDAAPVPGERILGWFAHYAIGIALAAILLILCGPGWAHSAQLLPALALGLGSLAIPFFIMQPAFGIGIAAARAPNPATARLRSLTAHLSFGFGLYLSAQLARGLA